MRGNTQIARQLPDRDVLAISGSTELEHGARGMLLLAEGAFRLDVCPLGDTLKLVVRGVDGAEVTSHGEGCVGSAIRGEAQLKLLRELRPSSFDFTVEILDGERRRSADIVIGVFRIPDRGTTRFTAQAMVRGSSS